MPDNPLHIPMPILMLLSRFSRRILLLGYIFHNTFHKLANLVAFASAMYAQHTPHWKNYCNYIIFMATNFEE